MTNENPKYFLFLNYLIIALKLEIKILELKFLALHLLEKYPERPVQMGVHLDRKSNGFSSIEN
jgi:hypothetical protein